MFLNNFINITVPCKPFIGAVSGCSVHICQYIINIMYTGLLVRVSEVFSTSDFENYFHGFGTSNVELFSSRTNLLKNFKEFPRRFSRRNVRFFPRFNRLETCFPGLLQASRGLIAPFCVYCLGCPYTICWKGGRQRPNKVMAFFKFFNPVILTPGRYNGGQVYINYSNL